MNIFDNDMYLSLFCKTCSISKDVSDQSKIPGKFVKL